MFHFAVYRMIRSPDFDSRSPRLTGPTAACYATPWADRALIAWNTNSARSSIIAELDGADLPAGYRPIDSIDSDAQPGRGLLACEPGGKVGRSPGADGIRVQRRCGTGLVHVEPRLVGGRGRQLTVERIDAFALELVG
jgi:hypothetical protein